MNTPNRKKLRAAPGTGMTIPSGRGKTKVLPDWLKQFHTVEEMVEEIHRQEKKKLEEAYDRAMSIL